MHADGSLGETGGYVAQGTQEGLEGSGNISRPRDLSEGDSAVKPADGESGFSFKDLSGALRGTATGTSVLVQPVDTLCDVCCSHEGTQARFSSSQFGDLWTVPFLVGQQAAATAVASKSP